MLNIFAFTFRYFNVPEIDFFFNCGMNLDPSLFLFFHMDSQLSRQLLWKCPSFPPLKWKTTSGICLGSIYCFISVFSSFCTRTNIVFIARSRISYIIWRHRMLWKCGGLVQKVSRTSQQWQQSINPSAGPFWEQALCDCTGHTPLVTGLTRILCLVVSIKGLCLQRVFLLPYHCKFIFFLLEFTKSQMWRFHSLK